MTRHVIIIVGLLTISVLGLSAALAKPKHETVFWRMHLAEHKASNATTKTLALKKQLPAFDKRIAHAIELRSTTARAAIKLKAQSTRRQAAWDGAYRKIQRQSILLTPGHGADTQHLLKMAERHVHQQMARDYQLLEQHRTQGQKVWSLVQQKSARFIELAQQQATSKTAQAEKQKAAKDAKVASPQTISRDLKTTDKKLQGALKSIPKNPSTKDFHRLKGALVPPVNMSPSHRFGPRKQLKTRTYVRHSGLTYSIEKGSKVKAIGPGLVVFAGWFEGYGQVVIIDHGVGYHSVYAHLSKMMTKAGASIKRGQVFALSGDSGSLEGAKLYFEMRKKGFPIDPAPWFFKVKK